LVAEWVQATGQLQRAVPRTVLSESSPLLLIR
jgi:hypothetical protein